VKKVFVIGIGPGHPEQITVQAIDALNRVDVFFVIEKRDETAELVQRRRAICERYATRRPYRFVAIEDLPRDRSAPGYRDAVAEWHRGRVAAFADVIDAELNDGDTGAFLAWGDPSLYDSTVRILDQVTGHRTEIEYEVIPGVTSVQVLAARHRVPLNRIGGDVHVTTGRNLAAGWPVDADSVVVMLDGANVFRGLCDDDLDIYWGAYLGTDDEILVRGRLGDVVDEIVEQRAAARARKGWIMDTYLLRRRAGVPAGPA
jgi:precorrin-6A synthase